MRPLFDDKSANPSAVTRDYVFDVEAPAGQAPMLSVFGGKITTYRRLAEHALGEAFSLPAADVRRVDGARGVAGRRHS